ncbi:MAG: MFS transporter [Burkholderiales bacterium]|nr:MFS transporter [Burkholderiales bacterium]
MGDPPERKGTFGRVRALVFAIVLASFVLSFVHRTAPAAIAAELTAAFSIPAAVLGTLAATYFYVYTVLQIPVGVLADTLGPRRLLASGSAIAAVGSLLFALAPAWEWAAVGRTLVGIGVSVAFLAILKVSAVWFPANRFATLNGYTMFAGNLGAVAAGAPLAWLVTQTSWRSVFVGLAAVSAALAAATWIFVRDRPEQKGYAPVNPMPAGHAPAVRWRAGLAAVLVKRSTWAAFIANAGVGGTYLAFAGLWAVPWLEHTYGYTRVVAAQHTSLLMLGVAFGAVAIGVISDRLGNRLDVMRFTAFAQAASWLPWVVRADWPQAATLAWFFAMGLVIPGFTLSWTIAKESNRPEHSGIATSVVNTGIFLGTGILQPLVGWVVDRSKSAGDLAGAWSSGIVVLALAATLGAFATLAIARPHR